MYFYSTNKYGYWIYWQIIFSNLFSSPLIMRGKREPLFGSLWSAVGGAVSISVATCYSRYFRDNDTTIPVLWWLVLTTKRRIERNGLSYNDRNWKQRGNRCGAFCLGICYKVIEQVWSHRHQRSISLRKSIALLQCGQLLCQAKLFVPNCMC